MNATTRLTSWDIFTKVETTPVQEIWNIVLAVAFVLVTALSLIYVKDLNRQLYSELESFRENHEELKIQKDQLLLEQNTWAAQSRVQEIASEQLNMVWPNQLLAVVIKKS
jgi:cell division protein FtsL